MNINNLLSLMLALALGLMPLSSYAEGLPPALDPTYNPATTPTPEEPVTEATPSAEQICNEILPDASKGSHHYADIINIQCKSWKDNKKYIKAQKEVRTMFFAAGGVCLFECVKDIAKGMACAGATGFAFMMDQQKAKDLERSNHDTSHVGKEEDQAFLNQLYFEMQLAKQVQDKGMDLYPATKTAVSFLAGKEGGYWGVHPQIKVSKRIVANELNIKAQTRVAYTIGQTIKVPTGRSPPAGGGWVATGAC